MAGSTSDSKESLAKMCAPLLMRRSKPSQSSAYLREWKAGNLMRLQSGLISKVSLGERFQTAWISFLAATPASHLAQPGNDSEQKTQDTCGPSSQMELESCDPNFVSLRTSKDTLALDSEKSSKNWEASVTKRRGAYSARVKLAHLTKGNECSSWPTARSRDWKDTGDLSRVEYGMTLGRAVQVNPSTNGNRQESSKPGWPTPRVSDIADSRPNVDQSLNGAFRKWLSPTKNIQANLSDSVQLLSRQESWATPIVGDSHLASTPEVAAKRLAEGKVTLSRQNAGKLNPRWVETLMGLPVGWTMPSCQSPVTIVPTNSDSSVTESSQLPQPELF